MINVLAFTALILIGIGVARMQPDAGDRIEAREDEKALKALKHK